MRSRLPSRSPIGTPSVCEGRGVHVGILGGTGPAGRGVAVRLAESGAKSDLGSRDAERASGIAEELRAKWPDLSLDIGGADNAGRPSAEVVVLGHALGQRHSDVEAARELLAGKVVVSMANALVKEGREMLALIPPRGSVAAAVRLRCPTRWWRPPSTICRPGKWRTWNRGWKLTCWCVRTIPRPLWSPRRSSS